MVPPKLHAARLEDLEHVTGGGEVIGWATAGEAPPWLDGVNLVLLGATGVGKSHAAVAAARSVIDQGRLCLYWPVPELLTAVHWEAPDHRRVMAEAQRCAVLVLDDLGAEQPNEWSRRKLYELLNHRWNANLPTIATTNLEPRDLEADDGPIGPRTYSRLAGGAIAVRLVGPDRRRARA
jgi:DNA replication protein DnaC